MAKIAERLFVAIRDSDSVYVREWVYMRGCAPIIKFYSDNYFSFGKVLYVINIGLIVACTKCSARVLVTGSSSATETYYNHQQEVSRALH